jgi:hypothetical protein
MRTAKEIHGAALKGAVERRDRYYPEWNDYHQKLGLANRLAHKANIKVNRKRVAMEKTPTIRRVKSYLEAVKERDAIVFPEKPDLPDRQTLEGEIVAAAQAYVKYVLTAPSEHSNG